MQVLTGCLGQLFLRDLVLTQGSKAANVIRQGCERTTAGLLSAWTSYTGTSWLVNPMYSPPPIRNNWSVVLHDWCVPHHNSIRQVWASVCVCEVPMNVISPPHPTPNSWEEIRTKTTICKKCATTRSAFDPVAQICMLVFNFLTICMNALYA